jgi:HK97 family phage major capsid protein
MSSKTNRLPVLSVLPTAYWVTGDTGLKETDAVSWENVTLTAEELAVIVPIPEAYIDDAVIDVIGEVRPLIAEAFGRALDLAALFNVSRPASWSAAIVNDAYNTYNFDVQAGETSTDLYGDFAELLRQLAVVGVQSNGTIAEPGFKYRLATVRDAGAGAFVDPTTGAGMGRVLGDGFVESMNGGWVDNVVHAIVGDWSKALVGVRQDVTMKVFTEGVISDGSGNVVLNLMQQDSIAIRAVARFAFATANPVTPNEATEANRFHFGVLHPASS